MRRTAPRCVLIGCVLCAVVACGSTVQNRGSGPGSTLNGEGLSAPGAPSSAGTPGQLGPGVGAATGAGAGAGGFGGTGTGSAGFRGLAPGAGSLGSQAPLLVGVVYQRNVAAGDAALGASNNDPGDFKADYSAFIDYLNKHGGIAGRPVQPVFYEFDAASTQDISTQEQRACDYWTHDNHVDAILIGQSDIIKECARKAGIIQLSIEESSTDGPGFARYPALVEVTAVGLDRVGQVTVDGLTRLHYFDGVTSAQLGLVTWDLPAYRHAIDYGYLPALRNLGLSVFTQHRAYLRPPETANDLAVTSNDARAAALRFAQDGVNRVMILDGHAGLAVGAVVHIEFMVNAEALHYRPKYGLNGTSGFSAASGTYPKAQQHGAVGVGWSPAGDLSASDYPPSAYSPTRKRCLQIFAQYDLVAANANAEANMTGVCDELLFFQLVGSRINGPMTTASFISAVARLGSAFVPAGTYSTSFVNRRDGASGARNLVFVDDCTCYRYVGSLFRI